MIDTLKPIRGTRRADFAEEVGPMQSCAYGEVCLGGSYCLAGICVCPAGNIKLNDECIPRATVPPSSTCNSTVQCSGGSSCVANICQCRDSQQSVNGICELLPAGIDIYSLFEVNE